MCLDCGCVLNGTGTPNDDHGDPQHITLDELAAAAAADQVSIVQAAANMLATAQLVQTDALPDDDVAKAPPSRSGTSSASPTRPARTPGSPRVRTAAGTTSPKPSWRRPRGRSSRPARRSACSTSTGPRAVHTRR